MRGECQECKKGHRRCELWLEHACVFTTDDPRSTAGDFCTVLVAGLVLAGSAFGLAWLIPIVSLSCHG